MKGEGELSDGDDPLEPYSFTEGDRELLEAASVLLKKVAGAQALRPAQLVSVAKLLHVFSRLPRVTPDLDVTVSVVGPRRKFDEIETWHYWDVGIERKRLFLASGGHFYQPSTGGDSFTTMNWEAVPGERAKLEDYRETLWMVPDLETFGDGVADIELTCGAYRVEITDSDNSLLEVETGVDESEAGAQAEAQRNEAPEKDLSVDEHDEEPDTDLGTRRPWSVTPIDIAEERLSATIDPLEVDSNAARQAFNATNCDSCGCVLIDRGLFVDGRLRGQLMWGNMCADCFERKGDGLGWGRGQLYARQSDGSWRMVGGFRRHATK